MALDGNKTASLVFGGLLMGIWLYIVFWTPELDWRGWLGWGFVGLVLAGGLYAGRIGSDVVRVAVWVGIGISLGLLVTAAVVQESINFLAAAITFLGGALIVAGLPAPGAPGPQQEWQKAE